MKAYITMRSEGEEENTWILNINKDTLCDVAKTCPKSEDGHCIPGTGTLYVFEVECSEKQFQKLLLKDSSEETLRLFITGYNYWNSLDDAFEINPAKNLKDLEKITTTIEKVEAKIASLNEKASEYKTAGKNSEYYDAASKANWLNEALKNACDNINSINSKEEFLTYRKDENSKSLEDVFKQPRATGNKLGDLMVKQGLMRTRSSSKVRMPDPENMINGVKKAFRKTFSFTS